MTEQDIIDGNLLIAKFMGAAPHGIADAVRFPNSAKRYFPEHLKYYSSWSWLMPVIERICDLTYEDGEQVYPITFGMKHTDGSYMFRFSRSILCYGKTMQKAAWSAAVDFLTIGVPVPSTCDATRAQPKKTLPTT